MRSVIKLVVCDLDNTLYDWVTFFSRAFYAMVDIAVPILGVDKDQILDELQAIHKHYHNSEQPFALLEIPSTKQRFPALAPEQMCAELDSAFHKFNSVRNSTLRPYPGVHRFLSIIAERGTRIVGHTEATVLNAEFRLKKLNLISFFEKIYAIEHQGPEHPRINYYKQSQNPSNCDIRILRLHQRKPDKQILLNICADAGVRPAEALYVGDSITRDIGMANAAGVHSAWAKYGTLFDTHDWDNLVRISHWCEEDITRNNLARRMYGSSKPEVVLEKRIDELLDFFDFVKCGL
ncbi:MAG: HAD family hydrolase [Cyanobacteriota bacterium]|jgi:FMN phosphatase YigB (HAD superfamily)